jgi:hypothetical protein
MDQIGAVNELNSQLNEFKVSAAISPEELEVGSCRLQWNRR